MVRLRPYIALSVLVAVLVALPVLPPHLAGRLTAQEPCAQERRDASAPGADEYDWIALGRCLLEAGLVDATIEALRRAAERD